MLNIQRNLAVGDTQNIVGDSFKRAKHRIPVIFAGILLASYFFFLLSTVSAGLSDWIPDDAFITYRYARNLSEGYEFRYNVTDEESTQGFSSLSHMTSLSLLYWLGCDLKTSSRILSIASFWMIPILVGASLKRPTRAPLTLCIFVSSAIHIGLFHLYPPLKTSTEMHLLSGMETLFYMLTVTLITSMGIREGLTSTSLSSQKEKLLCIILSVSFLIPMITRPEGLILSVATFVAIVLVRVFVFHDKHYPYGRTSRSVMLFVAVGFFGLLVWKLAVFSYLLPNPFYVKSHHSLMITRIDRFPGLDHTLSYLRITAPLVFAFIVSILLGRFGPQLTIGFLILCLPGLLLVLTYIGAIHEMAFGYRYEFPYTVYVEVMGAYAVLSLLNRVRSHFRLKFLTMGLVSFGLLIKAYFSYPASPSDFQAIFKDTTEKTSGVFSQIGKELRDTCLGEQATLVTGSAGKIPFFSNFKTIDLWGLNTNELSGRRPMPVSGIWEFIQVSMPDVIVSLFPPATTGSYNSDTDPVMQSKAVQRMLSAANGRIELFLHWDTAKMKEVFYDEMLYIRDHCVYGGSYQLSDSGYFIIIYVRRDSLFLSVIQDSLQRSDIEEAHAEALVTFRNDPMLLNRGGDED